MKKLIYLACPYSHHNELVIRTRVERVTAMAAKLSIRGYNVFSPLTHSHYIAEYIRNHCDHDFWLTRDLELIKTGIFEQCFVYCLPGWESSFGISVETKLFKELNIPIHYLDDGNLDELTII